MLALIPIAFVLGAVVHGLRVLVPLASGQPARSDAGAQAGHEDRVLAPAPRHRGRDASATRRSSASVPPPTPEMPRMCVLDGGIDNKSRQLTPRVDARGAMSRMKHVGGLGPRRHPAGAHRARLSAARLAARHRGLGAWCSSRSRRRAPSRTRRSSTRSRRASSTTRRSRPIARWKYNPKVEDGVAVERVGVQTMLTLQAGAVAMHAASATSEATVRCSRVSARGRRSAGAWRSRERSAQHGSAQGKEAARRSAHAARHRRSDRQALNEAIELSTLEKYAEAQAADRQLNLEKLSPYERSRVEQILFSIAYCAGEVRRAREHLQKAIDSGGLNEQEISQAKYQIAQLFIAAKRSGRRAPRRSRNGSRRRTNPNSAAYYLLAVAYYQHEGLQAARSPPAQEGRRALEKPQESWLSMLLALLPATGGIQAKRSRCCSG